VSEARQSTTSALLKQAVLRTQAMRQRLEEVTRAAKEPIAVVGMGCRFPGGCDTPERYWSFLLDNGIGVREVPEDRWSAEEYYDPTPGRSGKIYVRESNFLERDVAAFDARFFRISPVEANAMDPQQRQLLEVCWEALENAGQRPSELRGSNTGVFIGVSSNSEYGTLVQSSADVNEYIGTGTTSSVASGRLAYAFGWSGPALSLDTACSSSLVSAQLAVDALRRRDCDMAVAGGVSMMLAPSVMSSLCAMNALAPDGRSKPFDASADGYGRGEGCGIVVLKRLSDAQRDSDTVYALIKGGAVNNDGESSGLTIPNGRAQRAVLETALTNSGLSPDAVDYLETHGTGTLLGDPIEVDAINQVYGRTRQGPLTLGAVKGNIGHLESAAGVASLIKAVLSLHHGRIAPITGLGELNPRIEPMRQSFTFPTRAHEWPATPGRPRYAAVSSFGFSGTNAHMILTEASQSEDAASTGVLPPRDASPPRSSWSLLTLTGTTERNLVQQIRAHQAYLEERPEVSIQDACYTANTCRNTFAHRAVFIGRTRAEVQASIAAVLEAAERQETLYSGTTRVLGSSSGHDRYNAKRTLFTDFAAESAYAARIDQEIRPKFAFVFRGEAGTTPRVATSLRDELPVFRAALDDCQRRFEAELGRRLPPLDGTDPSADDEAAQAWLFASQYAFCRLLESYGVAPHIAFGESTGSLVAAMEAGLLDLDSAVRLCVALCAARRGGQDAAWRRSVEREVYQRPGTRFQTPRSLLVTHKAEAIRDDLRDSAPTTSGGLTEGLRALYDQGYRFFIEVGDAESAAGTSASSASDTELGDGDTVTVSLAGEGEAVPRLLRALAKLTCLGSEVSWEAHYAGQARRKLMLPNYPFEQSRHWLSEPESAVEGLRERLSGSLSRHGLAGQELNLPVRQKHYLYTFTHDNFAELLDNSGVVHIGYYLEMLLAAVRDLSGEGTYRVRQMRFVGPIVVFAQDIKEVLLLLDPDAEGGFGFQFHSRDADAKAWNLNVSGEIGAADGTGEAPVALDALRSGAERHVAAAEFYRPLEQDLGFHFGPAVRWVEEAWLRSDDALVRFGAEPRDDVPGREHALGYHPGILDSSAQVCNFLSLGQTPEGTKYMVSGAEEIVLRTAAPTELFAEVTMEEYDAEGKQIAGGIRLLDESGAPVATLGRLWLKEFDDAKIAEMKDLMEGADAEREGADTDFLLRYGNASAERKGELLLEYLTGLLARILEMDRPDIEPDEPMSHLGLDSMTGLRFFNKTNQLLGVDVQFADVIQSDNMRELARRMADVLPGGTGELQTAQTKPYDTDLRTEHWLHRHAPRPRAKIRLFCFPNGYRNADMFDAWAEQLPEVDICAVRVPGIDVARLDEMPPSEIDDFMRTLERVLDPHMLDLPCATFGHSWGSLFSFRLARLLSQNPRASLAKAFVSGFAAPAGPNPTIVKILDELGRHGMTRVPAYEEIRHDPEMVTTVVRAYQNGWGYGEEETRLSLPQLLAACGLIDRYTHDAEEKFRAPITAFHGVDDWVASEEIKLWEDMTHGGFALHTMAGDHQFINENQSEKRLLYLIREELAEVLDNGKGEHGAASGRN